MEANVFDEPSERFDDEPDVDARAETYRCVRAKLEEYELSGQFTPCELRTIRALVMELALPAQIAEREGVSRQAIRERLVGNRKGQGGIFKKAPQVEKFWTAKNRLRRRRS